METPAKIKKGLECCPGQYFGVSCGNCLYSNDGVYCGENGVRVMKDALEYIEQLEAELEAVKRERDAAKSDLCNAEPCFTCLHFRRNGGDCGGGSACQQAMWECIKSNREYTGNVYEWRGVCPENTEVQE